MDASWAEMESLRTLFVSNLTPEVTRESLNQTFSRAGKVIKCFLVGGKGKSTHKGNGFVEFSTSKEAKYALKTLNDYSLGGANIRVSICFA